MKKYICLWQIGEATRGEIVPLDQKAAERFLKLGAVKPLEGDGGSGAPEDAGKATETGKDADAGKAGKEGDAGQVGKGTGAADGGDNTGDAGDADGEDAEDDADDEEAGEAFSPDIDPLGDIAPAEEPVKPAKKRSRKAAKEG